LSSQDHGARADHEGRGRAPQRRPSSATLAGSAVLNAMAFGARAFKIRDVLKNRLVSGARRDVGSRADHWALALTTRAASAEQRLG